MNQTLHEQASKLFTGTGLSPDQIKAEIDHAADLAAKHRPDASPEDRDAVAMFILLSPKAQLTL